MYTDYVLAYKRCGELIGDGVKYMWSSSTIEDDDIPMYKYPDSEIEIIDPIFDELKLPGFDYDLYPDFIEYSGDNYELYPEFIGSIDFTE